MGKHRSRKCYGAFTLPDTETDKDIDKKMGCTEWCESVYTAHRQTPTQIPIGFYTTVIYRYQSLLVSVSGSVSTPLDSKEGYQRSHLTNLKVLPRAANEYAPIFKAFP